MTEATAGGGEWWEDAGSGVYHRMMTWLNGWIADCGTEVTPTKWADHRDPSGQACPDCHALNQGGDPDDEDEDRRLADTPWESVLAVKEYTPDGHRYVRAPSGHET